MNALLESQRHAEALRAEHGFIYGFDTSLAHFGYAVATDFDGPLRFVAVGVLTTKPTPKDKRESKTDDNRRRFEGLANALFSLVARHGPARALCVEATAMPFGKTTSTTLAALGRARGLVDALAANLSLSAHEYQSQTLKKAVTGDRFADKSAVIAGVVRVYPELDALFAQLNAANREHAADAAACVHAFHATPTEEF
jgi:Holliday junction resolvasome RuvABC endonuclease subunit